MTKSHLIAQSQWKMWVYIVKPLSLCLSSHPTTRHRYLLSCSFLKWNFMHKAKDEKFLSIYIDCQLWDKFYLPCRHKFIQLSSMTTIKFFASMLNVVVIMMWNVHHFLVTSGHRFNIPYKPKLHFHIRLLSMKAWNSVGQNPVCHFKDISTLYRLF